MNILNEERLAEFIRHHPEAKSALLRWADITRRSTWQNISDVRRTFRTADRVCECVVFDILGNNYRLITGVNYGKQAVTLKHFLTHREYDRGRWKKDCGC